MGSDDRPNVDAGKPVKLAFQYFPDTINDSKAVNYQQKEIAGGSLPLYQWIAGGERLITFTAIFTSDVDLVTAEAPTGLIAKAVGTAGQGIRERLQSAGESRRNVDIRSAIVWLRRYMFPTYVKDESNGTKVGVPLTYAPSKLMLVMPGSGIGLAGGESAATTSMDAVLCVMTQCDVTYEKFFPSGLPRIASVSLGFAQIPQLGGHISFPHRGAVMDAGIVYGGEGPNSFFGYNLLPRTKNGGS
jgi:hypothetical protein